MFEPWKLWPRNGHLLIQRSFLVAMAASVSLASQQQQRRQNAEGSRALTDVNGSQLSEGEGWSYWVQTRRMLLSPFRSLPFFNQSVVRCYQIQPKAALLPESVSADGKQSDAVPLRLNVHMEKRLPKTVALQQYQANNNMEDRTSVAQLRVQGQTVLMCSVIDGHGGHQVAEYVKQHLAATVQDEISQAEGTASPLPPPPPSPSSTSTAASTPPSSPSPSSSSPSSPPQAAASSSSSSAFRSLSRMDLEKTLRGAHLSLDKKLMEAITLPFESGFSRIAKVGACCVSVMVTDSDVYVTNVGDCRAVLCKGGKAVTLTTDHTANSVAEQERLKREHPKEEDIVVCKRSITRPRRPSGVLDHLWEWARGEGSLGDETVGSACYVKGRLQPTRAFGDFHLKDEKFVMDKDAQKPRAFVRPPYSFPYISADPDVKSFRRSDTDAFLVLACDGVWDFLTADEVVAFVLEEGLEDLQKAADRVVAETLKKAAEESGMTLAALKALDEGTRRRYHDDTTVVVIRL
uniref:PPM-type phosphatase domain-containing protein n=1 Tax=Chromera velia CCMP2878 TaxID=1169474 RepID=A0A0G4HTH8_9ALVE|mmetsp:Transcript_45851/g.90318  ORF Transcript_45851/g.90318 Transcript_45851/m.90318 type:complete len:518 (+) Transcript_45851:404-1957(+)|eukprot:Cvel_8462.t1-p1 / transcript=Cvel_8462.t1 / gene=Cvel_8462 / organism=Chromera_velia_CCMP2878 / gene_product=Probable protein phosphatase 2C 67, putative / transcript_product=Probable protein phosphatase 2C 67, putative / location=Cvel_scaffold467:66334-69727(-) / protein_length=517 / sequence_SO=supercontig / SO=protein_coding / is_pseudo=false